MTRPTLDNPRFGFKTAEDADAFRKEIHAAGLRHARQLYWHDKAKPFPKEVIGASCFVLRFADRHVGVTAAHVVRAFQKAKATTRTMVCQFHLMEFDLEATLIDICDALDIATFAVTARELTITETDAFDVSGRWPLDGVVVRDASIQLVGYPQNIRIVNPADRSAIFQAWGALDFIEDFNEREIILIYDPEKVVGSPTKPPLGYDMSGCSGGPAIVHEIRPSGLHLWHPVGLIVGGSKLGEGDAAEFDIIRARRIDCIRPDGQLQRDPNAGWLPSR